MRNFASTIKSIIILIFAALLTSCTSGVHYAEDGETRNYELQEFNGIALQGAYIVELTQGENIGLVMTTTENLHRKLKIWVDEEKILHIKNPLKNVGVNEVKLELTFNQIQSLLIEGGVSLTTVGFLEFDTFDLKVEGGAHINMDVKAHKITSKVEGGANIDFEGICDEFYISSEGACNIDADHLKSSYVMCNVSGVGNASVYATDKLDAKLEGLGLIAYRGDPKVNKQVNGLGFIHKK